YGINAKTSFLNMDLLPELPYHLIDIQKYTKYRGGEYTISFETSRGCNYRCAFCACPQYSYIWRGMAVDKVVSDIKYLKEKLKIKAIFIIDDNFFGDIERARAIFCRLAEEEIGVVLDIYGMRIDTVERLSSDDFECMIKAGVRKVLIGIESGSQRVLNFINKSITVAQVLEQNRRIARYGIYVQYNFITGYPTETLDELRETVNLAFKLIKENKRAMINYFCIYVPLPGSQLYEFEKSKGMPVPKTINEWIEYDRIFVTNRKDVDLNIKLNIISLFIDKKVCFFVKSLLLRFLAGFYRPFARFRMRHLFFAFFIEEKMFMLINRMKFKLDK
ncbi:MAG: radical SAM protein, partial [Candidatus Omnitrophica bacterium]|nr:radical SAM protein [Candidatus Omnitrophota bacterium]